jgi:hypothetical protein
LASQASLTNIFDGFKSRWIKPPECKYKRALAIWYRMYLRCFSARIF